MLITHVERSKAMAHAKAIFAVDNLKLSPIGEAISQQLVDGTITSSTAIKLIVADHHRKQAKKASYTAEHSDLSLAQQA